jgi:hypothetical protein
MSAFKQLVDGMGRGRQWSLMGSSEKVKELLDQVYR